jgi:hypothetical protein
MNFGDSNELIAGRESDRVKFKRATGQQSDAARTVCAVRNGLVSGTPDRTVQENLQMLHRIGMVDGVGKGRGARWMLKGVRS